MMNLTREQWARVEALFSEARGQPEGRRLTWLRRRRGREQAAVIDEVTALITASESDTTLPEVVLVSREPVDEDAAAANQTLGPWKLGRLIGRGGMGEVYLAERADQAYEQQVAIKLLKRGIDTDAVLRRFLRERRILGRFNHPNVARLIDAGATPEGRPYLVMELVKGRPINEWCAERRLGVRPTLELMVAVCEAVHAAHRQQVVHRDIKPSNVLIDDDGLVKLLDFGIAKLIGEGDEDETQTQVGTAPATPRYAAPEQMLGRPVTPASDVYSLGMLLYELLAGRLPPGRRTALMAIVGSRKDRGIPPPSVTAGSGESGALGSGEARRLRASELAGDLDHVVLKAVDEIPQRRYTSAADLADDLRRHLDGRPVSAQADSRLYVARKFVTRNWVPVSAAAAVALALLAGLAAALWEAKLARAEARRAEEVKDFVLSVFDSQDPLGGAGASQRTPRELIRDAIARLDRELTEEPSLHAELLADLSSIQLQIDDGSSASVPLDRAIAERAALDGADSPRLVALLNHKALYLHAFGRIKDAHESAERALAILHKQRRADENELARTQIIAISTLGTPPTPADARTLEEAVRSLERNQAADDPDSLRALFSLARMYESTRQNDLATKTVADLLLRTQRRYGDDSLAYGKVEVLQGNVMADAYKPEAAIAVFQRAIAIFRAHHSDDRGLLSQALTYMATQLRVLRRFDEALAAYQEAERSYPPALQSESVGTVANIRRGEGRIYLLLGQADKAEDVLGRAAKAEAPSTEGASGFHWYLRSEWARALAAQGKLEQAEAVQREAAARLEAVMGPASYQNALILDALATTLEMRPGGRAEAETLRRRALDIVAAKYGKGQERWAEYAHDLEHNLLGAGTAAADADGLKCWRALKSDHRCSLKIDQGWKPRARALGAV